MSGRFHGKNVFVTGSSRGIGLAIAREFGLLGANVALNCDKSFAEMEQGLSELGSLGVNAIGLRGDVSVYGECEKIFRAFEEKFGSPDILINNAGVSEYGLFTDLCPEEWESVTRTNLFSVFNCCHIVLPEMIRKKEGRIINISSIWGERGASCEAVYSATKGAVNSFTKALSKELAPSGIIVNAIALGVIDTKMNERFTEEEREELIDSIGLMRFGTASDAAKLCVYLAETEYMTGQILTLDGGFLG